MFDKIKNYLSKNMKSILKVIWGVILFCAGIHYIYHNYVRISVSSNAIDNIIIVGTLILAFLPFISEISLMGFSVKKEIQNTKQEMKDALVDLKYQMIDIKSNITQNNTQSINLQYLPSREEIDSIINNTNKPKAENEQKNIKIENEVDMSDDTIYLFKVRNKLEKYITKICDNIGYTDVKSLIQKIDILKKVDLITIDIYQYLRQILNICNRGIHGEIISQDYINFVKKITPQICSQLDEVNKNLNYISCPKCKFVGYSKYENVCPQCGFVSDDY